VPPPGACARALRPCGIGLALIGTRAPGQDEGRVSILLHKSSSVLRAVAEPAMRRVVRLEGSLADGRPSTRWNVDVVIGRMTAYDEVQSARRVGQVDVTIRSLACSG
jgi:hypothetical protein